MRNILISLFFLFFYVYADAQKTIDLHTQEVTKGIQEISPIREIEERSDGIVVTYHFDKILLFDDPLYKNANIVKINGFWPNTKEGTPATLSRWDTFAVPDKKTKVIVTDSSFVEIPLELSPSRPLLSNSGDETYTKENVKSISYFEGFYPRSVIPGTRNDQYRDQHLLDVCLNPIQYDYINKKMRVFTKIQYKLEYDTAKLSKMLLKNSDGKRISENSYLNNIILNAVSNDSRASASSFVLNASKYLIITVSKYAEAANKFAEWKRTLGFDVQVSMRNSWNTTEVKNVIRFAYYNDDIDYFLIIGGHDDVPAMIRYRNINSGFRFYPTDLNYACIDDGYTPDIFRGRLLVNTSDEAMTVVDKIINYERNPVTDAFFYNTGIHCAYFQDNDEEGHEDCRYVLTSEEIRNRMLDIKDSIHRVYCTEYSGINPRYWSIAIYANGEEIPAELQRPTFPWNGSAYDITNLINQKAFYVLMRDHGTTTGWSYPYYNNYNIINLNNGDYLPVVFSICCLTGKFTYSNCFCEKLLKYDNGGCVAIYGATEASYSGPNDVMAEGMFDAIWPSPNLLPSFGIIYNPSYSVTPTPTYRLGQILDQGLKRCDEAYLGTDKAWYSEYTHELYHCFGDPSMRIYTEIPTAFANASVIRQNGTIYVNTGGETATITFYNRGTGVIQSFRGTSQAYTDDPDISVCISGHNKIPYIDEGTLYIHNQMLANHSH